MTHFLIYIAQSYGIPIGMPLQEEIERRGFQVKWFCEDKEIENKVPDQTKLLKSVDDVFIFNPDVVLVTTNEVADFFPGLKVQVFHGFSVGKRSESKGHFNIRGFFDLYCTQGPSTTLPFKNLAKKHGYFKVVETGWSKVDPLFPLEPSTQSDRPVIMISSTFTTRLSLAKNSKAVEEIVRISKLGKWKFIVVLHPKMEMEIVKKFKTLEHDHFTFYDTTDLVPLYRQADVMISDTTSAITEFVLQNKPVVTFNNNKPEPYMMDIGLASEIEDALERALSKPDEIMEALATFIEDTHPYKDGKSSQRVIDGCLNFLENDTIKSKPFNLLRRYKIRKKLNYYKI